MSEDSISDLYGKAEDLSGRLVAIETNRERDYEVLSELKDDIRQILGDINDIKQTLAKSKGGAWVLVWVLSAVGGAGGWVLLIANILHGNFAPPS